MEAAGILIPPLEVFGHEEHYKLEEFQHSQPTSMNDGAGAAVSQGRQPRAPQGGGIRHHKSPMNGASHQPLASAPVGEGPAGPGLSPVDGIGATGDEWTHAGRTYCWMGEERMAQVGVTAGVKKVIAAVVASAKPGGKAAKGKPGAKRKAAAAATEGAGAPQQAKLSAFFKKKAGE